MQHESYIESINFSPNGTRLATDCDDNTASLWDAHTGRPLGESMRHEKAVNSVAFSPDGLRLATASADNTAHRWDAMTGLPLGEPMLHESNVQNVAFSPDGTRLATASQDKTARLWDLERLVPKNISAFINRFASQPDPSIPFDTEFQTELEAFRAKRNLRYHNSVSNNNPPPK